ncbi:HET-domain-containing protein [Hypoxylon rubiginosum]|uniref:HET-domain-containing protein n=1 Tax=Hypoxylon rubiginosum TaxID=110542 RepID=A0ACB9ZAG5_9PEZI|nr:HET-domain-containing protein [Hypoxylon rubiginosum]
MRLLNTTSLHLESFDGKFKPEYAILSHTWGIQEVLFEDIENRENLDWQHKSGYAKVEGSCRQARLDGYEYIWIDTCCINKSSSTELSEAINSMYKWYQSSAICYAFLEDVQDLPGLSASRWLSRGWTLQELIAPKTVLFYNKDWHLLGDRFGLAPQISYQTKIGIDVLTRGHVVNGKPQKAHAMDHLGYCSSCGVYIRSFESILGSFCVAQKMTWASHRKTTREEDIAYCLLGLFQVNMAPLYGEGSQAFRRLQEEIMKRWDDQSTFQLTPPYYVQRKWAEWAPRSDIEKMITNIGMEIAPGKLVLTALICPIPTMTNGEDRRIAILDCVMGGDLKSRPALLLQTLPGQETVYRRLEKGRVCIVEPPGRMRVIPDTVLYSKEVFYEGPIDIQQAKIERISIVEDAPSASRDISGYGLLQSQITQFSQVDTDDFQYGIRDSFPTWIDDNARTLLPSLLYAVVFENMSSIFFVLWRQAPENRCSIKSLHEVYNETEMHANDPESECTLANVMRVLRNSSNLLTSFGASTFPKYHTSRLLGAPGPRQRLVSVNIEEGAAFLDTKVIEVKVDISIPEDNGVK